VTKFNYLETTATNKITLTRKTKLIKFGECLLLFALEYCNTRNGIFTCCLGYMGVKLGLLKTTSGLKADEASKQEAGENFSPKT